MNTIYLCYLLPTFLTETSGGSHQANQHNQQHEPTEHVPTGAPNGVLAEWVPLACFTSLLVRTGLQHSALTAASELMLRGDVCRAH